MLSVNKEARTRVAYLTHVGRIKVVNRNHAGPYPARNRARPPLAPREYAAPQSESAVVCELDRCFVRVESHDAHDWTEYLREQSMVSDEKQMQYKKL